MLYNATKNWKTFWGGMNLNEIISLILLKESNSAPVQYYSLYNNNRNTKCLTQECADESGTLPSATQTIYQWRNGGKHEKWNMMQSENEYLVLQQPVKWSSGRYGGINEEDVSPFFLPSSLGTEHLWVHIFLFVQAVFIASGTRQRFYTNILRLACKLKVTRSV